MHLPPTVAWVEAAPGKPGSGRLRLLDQTRLPNREVYLELTRAEEVFAAIRRLSVRGAPAIGCAAALGLAAALGQSRATEPTEFLRELEKVAEYLESARPTAVNLAWALHRCRKAVARALAEGEPQVAELQGVVLREALAILEEDRALCRAIGDQGMTLFEGRTEISALTHCNAGALATGGRGTALAPLYTARERGLTVRVFADETRPLLQGARLTAWELRRVGIETTVICDSMAAQVMREGRVDLVIVGADRIAANGDVANKIGTYGLAVIAAYHRIPFYVAAPYSTVDLAMASGRDIPIEQRPAEEVAEIGGRRMAPLDCSFYNPAFDLTPAELVAGIVTERGVLRPPYDQALRELCRQE